MKVTEHIANADGKTLFSLEIIPPKKGDSIESLFGHIDPLMEFKPPFIDVTYHREEFVYKNRGNGLLEKKTIRKRPGTVGICAAIKNRYEVDPVPHIICGGFTKEETENALIDLNFLGIDNVLVLRGDSIAEEKTFKPEPDGNAYAIDLVNQVVSMNNARYLDEELQNAVPTSFCIGVAGYPEKHFEAPNMKSDLKYLKEKIDRGAEYIVTQMFFDNQKYFDFVEQCRAACITVPIIPGLKPITTKGHMTVLPSIFHIDIPDDLYVEIEKCKTNKEVKEVGIAWGIQQSKELMDAGVPVLHYYSMGKSDSVYRIAKELF
ncbi:methylenetetrahydrofolate reductase [NAD(P)H] [Marinoscillum furvescens]|uniref:Methylenetetrahydrofolate reductase n=1 Tax=Marinoscillum furvescens DSM 4134 TaxID=1122208 RepID=A0A3D9KZ87_MARFU|nr:methylenetetrahydrofolate reductase [NAD(P)H] [Marinoscillum furvescens]RED95602.1 5,10-methylenetetrahydrofolate reductase (NAD(P)) [Marinoscillum furvescens DSM 4134]